jgi:hypothetical protein
MRYLTTMRSIALVLVVVWACRPTVSAPVDSAAGSHDSGGGPDSHTFDSQLDSHFDSAVDSAVDSPSDSHHDSHAGGDTVEVIPGDTGEPVEEVPGATPPPDPFFDLDTVHTLDITVSDATMADLLATVAYTAGDYFPADIVYDGETVENVGIRLKGRWGSWRSISQKAAFKIDFNAFEPGRRFHGAEKLTLNNMIVDCSFNREQLAYYVFEALGIPASRTGYVWITVNGADYGLYLDVESIDDVFLDRNYADSSGNLYDAGYVIWPSGSYTLVDFNAAGSPYFSLSEGTDVGLADIDEVTDTLRATVGTDDYYDSVNAVMDIPAHALLVASEVWVGQIDGYSMNENNYYVYFDPTDGRGSIIPWDQDYSFIDEADWGFTWTRPSGVFTRTCIRDATCDAELKTALTDAMDVIDTLDLESRLDEGIALVSDYVTADPRKECSAAQTASYQATLRSWISTRRSHVEGEWGL